MEDKEDVTMRFLFDKDIMKMEEKKQILYSMWKLRNIRQKSSILVKHSKPCDKVSKEKEQLL